jgi:hypothetical protein
MGTFVANFHVRSNDSDAIRDTLAVVSAGDFRVSMPHNGWVSIYESRASTQDEAWIERLAQELSTRWCTVCVAFMVHDSDFARYWLNDQGQLLDEFNSDPEYFDDVSATERQRLQGRSDIFLRYCQPQVTREQVETVLRSDVTFAEETVSQLAEFLGIDPDRALDDFGHEGMGGGSGGFRFPDGGNDDDDNDDAESGNTSLSRHGMQARLMQMIQQKSASMFATFKGDTTSPQSDALVKAAAAGAVDDMEGLVAAGADVNAPGRFSIQPFGASSGMVAAAGLMPEVAVPPLIAAASNGQTKAVQRLLELGANAQEVHAVFGSALHAAVQRGQAETVAILLAAGVPADIKNAQGYSPRFVLDAIRTQLETTKKLVKSMPQLQGAYSQFLTKLSDMNLPESGWNACEELLRQAER